MNRKVFIAIALCAIGNPASAQIPDLFGGYMRGVEVADRANQRDYEMRQQILYQQQQNQQIIQNQQIQEQQRLAQQRAKEEDERLMNVYYASRFFNARKEQLDELKLKNQTISQLKTLGTPQALTALGIRYEIGYEVPESKTEAIKYYQLAAQKNLTIAQSNLGTMYLGGGGIEPNYTEAIKYLTLAANQNYPNAILNLAGMYLDGTGVPKDPSKATELYKQAAKKGYPTAAFLLGQEYASKSIDIEAVHWYKKAVMGGDALAMKNLIFHYYQGGGVGKSYAQAYFYSIIATANGIPASGTRDSIEKQLTRDDVLRVQTAANKWKIGEPIPEL